MINLTLDFETYYGTGYSLRLQRYNTPLYVRDPQFKVHCVGVKIDNGPMQVFDHDHFATWCEDHDWENTRLICHNMNFDGFILGEVYACLPKEYFCTLEASMGVFQGEIKNDLATVATRLGFTTKLPGLEDTKNKRELTPEEYTALAIYCANDVDLTYKIYTTLSATLPQSEQAILSLTKKQWCDPKLYLDADMIGEEHKLQVEKRKEIVERTGRAESNFTSVPKFAALLESKGVVVPTKWSNKKKTEVPAFAKDDLPWIELQDAWEKAGETELVNLAKARMACASNIAITRAARMHELANAGLPQGAPYRYWGAHTGRFSGAEQINLQNLKRGSRLRESIMAPRGYQLVVLDLSQIELRLNAYLAGEQWILDDLRAGICVYSRSAGKIYHDPDWVHYKAQQDTTPLYKDRRFVGKTTELGLGFGMGAPKFRHTLATGGMGKAVLISEDEAADIVYNIYRPTHPHIVEHWAFLNSLIGEMTREDCDIDFRGIFKFRHNHVVMPNGMYLYYPHLRYDEQENGFVYWDATKGFWKKIYGGLFDENLVQGSARIPITDAMLTINERYPVVMHTHDEIIALAHDSQVLDCYNFMYETMTTPPSWAPDLPLEAEGGFDVRYTK